MNIGVGLGESTGGVGRIKDDKLSLLSAKSPTSTRCALYATLALV